MDELQLFGKPDTAERKISFEIVSTATKIVLQHICMPSQQSNAERTSQKITQANLDGYLKLVASRRCVTILSCPKFSYLRGR
jgi:primosomal protein N'